MCKLVILSVVAIASVAYAYPYPGDHGATSYANVNLESHGGHGGHGGHDHHEVVVDHHAHPKYEFKYGVEDHHTGDIKSQSEHRDGDAVHGSYQLHQPDGTTRIVNYHADGHNGFNAEVKNVGKAVHPVTHVHSSHGHGWN